MANLWQTRAREQRTVPRDSAASLLALAQPEHIPEPSGGSGQGGVGTASPVEGPVSAPALEARQEPIQGADSNPPARGSPVEGLVSLTAPPPCEGVADRAAAEALGSGRSDTQSAEQEGSGREPQSLPPTPDVSTTETELLFLRYVAVAQALVEDTIPAPAPVATVPPPATSAIPSDTGGSGATVENVPERRQIAHVAPGGSRDVPPRGRSCAASWHAGEWASRLRGGRTAARWQQEEQRA